MEKKGNSKLIWYILFVLITVIMCYLFSVVFFFYISPYNISVKTKIWPFLSDSQMGAVYNDAIVDIEYQVLDQENFGTVDVSVVGVNVRKDGYVVAQLSSLEGIENAEEIQILPNSGQYYSGKLLYADKNHNLAILKCESLDGSKIKLPYVKVASIAGKAIKNTEIIALTSQNRKVCTGSVVGEELVDAITGTSEGVYKVDYVMDYCFKVDFDNSFSGGVVFNKSGYLFGFSVADFDADYVFMPVDAAAIYLDSVVECYENKTKFKTEMVDKFVGFDVFDVGYFIEQSSKNTDKTTFFFNGNFEEFTDNINYFARVNKSGFFLFEKLEHKGKVILNEDSVISSIIYDGNTYAIGCRSDLVKLLYMIDDGKQMTIRYCEIDSLGSQNKSVTFTV